MSFFPIFLRCRKTDRFPGTVVVTAVLNCHAKRKIRTDPDWNVLRNSGPVFDCLGNQTTTMEYRTSHMAHNKRVEALRNNPGGDWITADLEITATQFAIKFRKTTRTHVVFLHPSVPNCVSIPMKKKIRPVHVRAFLSMIERMDNVRG
jgi:hypothetical protein